MMETCFFPLSIIASFSEKITTILVNFRPFSSKYWKLTNVCCASMPIVLLLHRRIFPYRIGCQKPLFTWCLAYCTKGRTVLFRYTICQSYIINRGFWDPNPIIDKKSPSKLRSSSDYPSFCIFYLMPDVPLLRAQLEDLLCSVP